MQEIKVIGNNAIIETSRSLSDTELMVFNEAVVDFIYGKMRQGKTATATWMAWNDLNNGNVVYTSWKINWNGYDETKSKLNRFLNKIGFKKEFRIVPKENYHYLPYDGLEYNDDGSPNLSYYKPYNNFMDKFLSITDAKIYLDEGQKPLNSYEKTNIIGAKQDAIIFTGHFNRSITIIAQRPIQIHPILRINVSRYYKIEKEEGWFGTTFKRTEYQETDGNGLPDETKPEGEPVSYTIDKEIMDSYNSKYMRGSMKPSQTNQTQIVTLGKAMPIPKPPKNYLEDIKHTKQSKEFFSKLKQ